jgi:hypothetical protein
MDCPHCHKEIDDALVLAARNSLVAKRPRPGARGLVRNPAGKNKQTPKRNRAKKEKAL